MLSKRINDIIFIAIVVLVVIAIVIGRVIVLSNMDERIDEIEAENEALEQSISSDIALVDEFREENIPSASELARYVPSHYSFNTLSYFVYAQLEIEGIRQVEERALSVIIHEDVTYPSESRFNELSNEFFTNRIVIEFYAEDLEEVNAVIDRMFSVNQIFLLQAARYEVVEDDAFEYAVILNFVTFYDLD